MKTLASRTIGDRRRRPTPIFSRFMWFGGRRKAVRRLSDPLAVYVDHLSPSIVWAVVTIFGLHCLDAIFTLLHLQRGGRELNPVMDYFIQQGAGAFLTAKLGMAGLGLFFLGIHQNFPFVRNSLAGLFVVFSALVGYHCLLIYLS